MQMRERVGSCWCARSALIASVRFARENQSAELSDIQANNINKGLLQDQNILKLNLIVMEQPREPRNNRTRRKEIRAEAMCKYKAMVQDIRNMHMSEDPGVTQQLIKEQLVSTKELYPLVKKKLDGTAADARHFKQIMAISLEAAKRINVTTKHFELRRCIRRLRREVSGERGDKAKNKAFFRMIAEEHVNTFLCRPPSFTFFYGALRPEDIPLKKRTITRRPREQYNEAKTVTAVEKNVETDVEKDSTPKEVEYIYNQVQKLDDGASFFQTLVDPDSFIQTVENIFHVSFLVKEGKIGIEADDTKSAVLTFPKDSTTAREVGHQSILSFSMEDYNRWLIKYDVKSRAFSPRH